MHTNVLAILGLFIVFGVAGLCVAIWMLLSPTWKKAAAFSGVALICLVLFAHLRLWWLAETCRMQHMQALGREIPYAWHEEQEGNAITVPISTVYHVSDEYPYNYTLHLTSGYEYSTSAMPRGDAVLGYFEAAPAYPWWYLGDVLGLNDSEILVLYESYAVFAEPREWLQARSE